MIYLALAVLLLWLAAGYRLYMLRRARGFINISYAMAAAAIAAAFTVKAAEAPVDAATDPYISDLLEHLLVVGGGVAAQLFLLALRTGEPPRRAVATRVVIAAVVAMTMIVAFVAAPMHHEVSGDLDEVYGRLATVAVYRLVFNAYLTYVLVDNVRLCRRYAATPGDTGRSVSLTLVGWGSAIAVAYSASRVIYILSDLTVHRPWQLSAPPAPPPPLSVCADWRSACSRRGWSPAYTAGSKRSEESAASGRCGPTSRPPSP